MTEIGTVWLVHISPSRLLGHRERKGSWDEKPFDSSLVPGHLLSLAFNPDRRAVLEKS